ncbi:hypothetical protein C9374_010712 [Naegleria lovaniensis]|uniref:Telomeric single stranded DNA binding POT1/Cdc13 domain-containing protein n=1 Tax=Naegleria lovaniensis TaxID=51637 RepID=A0AA88GGE9_NAELO|nr:uncharacterized protein C9374_010712 [Naegleria lovaniensis]KAG2374428.1 hypothetical protein C9374_010712 [Naegleria lovaniensis]
MRAKDIDGTFSRITHPQSLRGYVKLADDPCHRDHNHSTANNKKRTRNDRFEFSFILEDGPNDDDHDNRKEGSTSSLGETNCIQVSFSKVRLSDVDFSDWISICTFGRKLITLQNVSIEPCIDDSDSDSEYEIEEESISCCHPYRIVIDKDSLVQVDDVVYDLECVEPKQQIAKKKKKPDYIYTKISEIQSDGTYNIYGVVCDYKTRRKTDMKTFTITLKIIDESSTVQNASVDSLLVTINYNNEKNICNCHCVGQLFRCHRLVVKKSKYGYQGNAGPGFDYFFMSSAIDQPVPDDLLYKKSFSEEDFTRITELKNFSNHFFSQSFDVVKHIPVIASEQRYLRDLAEAKTRASTVDVGFFLDVVCKVEEWESDGGDSLLLTVDDLSAKAKVAIKSNEVIDYLEQEVKYIFNENREVWVKLRNVHCPPIAEWADGRYVPLRLFNGSVVILPQKHFYISRCLEKSKNNVLQQPSTENRLCPAGGQGNIESIISTTTTTTKIDYSQAPITPLSEIIHNTIIPFKYRTRAKVVDYFPKQIEEFTRPSSQASSSTLQEYRYLFQIKLVDETGSNSLPLFLFDKEAEYFLQLAPCNLHENTTTKRLIEKKITELIQSNDLKDFCLLSYRVAPSSHASTNSNQCTRFSVFGTMLCEL